MARALQRRCSGIYCPEELLPGAVLDEELDEFGEPAGLDELLLEELPAPAPVRPAPDMSLEELLEPLWVLSLELLPLREAPSHFAYSCGVR